MPRALRVVLGFLLLDYTLYLWHRMNHHAPLLWRFHAVHHVDLDLDTTTGLRFHFGELAMAAGFRALQVLLLGVDRDTLRLWQQLLVLSVVFHHSNLELPVEIEARLNGLLVTPRMHGIHHSTRADETDSNYSSLLSCWDRLHRSLRLDVPQERRDHRCAGLLEAGGRHPRTFADAAVSRGSAAAASRRRSSSASYPVEVSEEIPFAEMIRAVAEDSAYREQLTATDPGPQRRSRAARSARRLRAKPPDDDGAGDDTESVDGRRCVVGSALTRCKHGVNAGVLLRAWTSQRQKSTGARPPVPNARGVASRWARTRA